MGVSRQIAAFVLARPELPPEVRAGGRAALLNMTGCAIGGAGEAAIAHLVALLPAFSGPATASLIGRAERADMAQAAYINAAAANIFDYDDTHIPSVIHPSAPVGPAVLALAETLAGQGQPVSGQKVLRAFVTGMEVTCRLGMALHPGHYARGWHITSTCGTFGAAMAAGQILGLDEGQLVDALGHALAQNSGSVETLGTMSKSLSVGQAARGGLLAAVLAARGYTGPSAPLEGERGFLRLQSGLELSEEADLQALTGDLGTSWQMLNNRIKPWPCGVVLNPVIEACLALHARAIDPHQIAQISLTGHPLLRQRTDRPGVTSGRQAQVSAQHAVAVSLMRGRAGLAEFSDAAVADPALQALGARLVFKEDPSLSPETAELRLMMRDGSVITHRAAAVRGSLAAPLSDANLAEKLRAQIAWRGLDLPASALIAALDQIETAADGTAFLALTRG